ncbi:VWA domain-containing protein, partial [Candidatus Hydrogenedentota bacterium]
MFQDAGGKHRAILLVTDGEDLGGKALKAAERARDAGVPIFALGVGTKKGAPIKDETGAYIKYRGDRVFTKLDENTLMQMAQTTGGAYV